MPTASPRVPAMGAYPAKQCPVRLQYRLLPPAEAVPDAVSSTDRSRMQEGVEFESRQFDTLRKLHPEAVLIDPANPAAAEATHDAMARRAPLILGGVLRPDIAGCRSGRPDILILEGDGYVPGDVKHHTLVKPATDGEGRPFAVSGLERPWSPEAREVSGEWNTKAGRDDAIQLAHYWRMLSAHGATPTTGPARGAVLDRGGRLVWVNLEEPTATTAPWQGGRVSWLEKYDHEFDFRVDVAAHTLERRAAEALGHVPSERKVLPIWTSECSACEWRTYCSAELESIDHVSLLPGTTWVEYRRHREHGNLTRHALATLDDIGAQVVASLSPRAIDKVLTSPPATPLAEVVGRSRDAHAAVVQWARQGIQHAGQLAPHLDETVLRYRGSGKTLPRRIDQARAAVHGAPLRARGDSTAAPARFAVEVDFDMESSEAGYYLWGALPVVDNTVHDYEAFDDYQSMEDPAEADVLEAQVFLRFWLRLAEWRSQAEALGGQMRLYHWSHAELTAMRSIGRKRALPQLPTPADVEAFIAAECVDLEGLFLDHVVVGHGSSLKTIAPLVGHQWRSGDEAGGDKSMLIYRTAVLDPDETKRNEAVGWLRTYNEDDVVATFRIRQWLRAQLDGLPRVEDWAVPR